jgi:hypothetical protein
MRAVRSGARCVSPFRELCQISSSLDAVETYLSSPHDLNSMLRFRPSTWQSANRSDLSGFGGGFVENVEVIVFKPPRI